MGYDVYGHVSFGVISHVDRKWRALNLQIPSWMLAEEICRFGQWRDRKINRIIASIRKEKKTFASVL